MHLGAARGAWFTDTAEHFGFVATYLKVAPIMLPIGPVGAKYDPTTIDH